MTLDQRPRHPARAGGFTLVELLVVIGIIGVLVGILLPVLKRAREQSQTVTCASNLRQLVQMSQVYAVDHDGYLPIGRGSNLRWVNYWFVDNSDLPKPALYMFGSLYGQRLMEDGRVAYCPSQSASRFQYNHMDPNPAEANPWPPKVFPPGTSQYRTKASYSMRPEYFVAFHTTISAYKLPRLPDLAGKTAFSDLVTHDTSVNTGHRSGLNRAMIDGSVTWVPFTVTDRPDGGTAIRDHLIALKPSNATNVKNAAIDGIFAALDRY